MSSSIKSSLAKAIRAQWKPLCEWHEERARQAPPPFYCSIDLRDSGFKVVPVDCNIYPAGFNNICPEDIRSASPIFRKHLEATAARAKRGAPAKILVLPESHTHNVYYIENLVYLLQILKDAGFETLLGWYGAVPEGEVGQTLKSETGKELQAYPITISDGVLQANGFVPDLIVLNNDFSGGYPQALDSVKQPIIPSHALGWHSRRKSEHFRHYNALAAEFAEIAGIDPWTIQIDTEEVSPVNFNEDQGTERVAQIAESVLARMRTAYAAHGLRREPFAFVKNNTGTYGMGIMVVRSADELRNMNRRTKNKMSVGKDRSQIESVAIQEGVPTSTIINRLSAEPVVYLCGGDLIGGFLRTHPQKGDEENLNSPGMVFKKLCMSDLDRLDETSADQEPLLELIYGSVARISALAAGRELASLVRRPPSR